MTGDIAKAIRWIHEHAKEFGGDPNSIFVMGHSAGAHLAALVCTDERYLKAEGLSFSIIKGCVPVDVGVYDITKRLNDEGKAAPKTFIQVFGKSADTYRDLSPVTQSRGQNIGDVSRCKDPMRPVPRSPVCRLETERLLGIGEFLTVENQRAFSVHFLLWPPFR